MKNMNLEKQFKNKWSGANICYGCTGGCAISTPMMDEMLQDISKIVQQEVQKEREKYIDALIWCSGSEDFQIDGKAREGWEKLCIPLINR